MAKHIRIVVGLEKQEFATGQTLDEQGGQNPGVSAQSKTTRAVLHNQRHRLAGVMAGCHRQNLDRAKGETTAGTELTALLSP
jgi:hypothetical protein